MSARIASHRQLRHKTKRLDDTLGAVSEASRFAPHGGFAILTERSLTYSPRGQGPDGKQLGFSPWHPK